ncbi:DNA topoisomerase family protein [Rodentibacter trehalosifermentans]|uniref:DNA topoisomerase type IA zn finger domain-containing protein n=1 Tax=Rodentibacter trehalosifermentans TaxID=1908263 RepID=A0A1V3IRF7_9PAST|nr:topoisomerase DNA-binding C4 zinc finger domain-containing protein [Rodentibacter trehalosifermentans]OOF44807.1 hypothetical protein BKK51_08120 [Rodentibacter trehalosifermentans]OOF48049.1 hypothetical protein BKK52_07020 [Rodentibacter trehalosifermentans]OOF53779.1 hypothetical protein BKK53_00420 [Rodentibacter trehalosifermentans]
MNQSLFHHTKQEEYCPKCGAILQMKQSKKGLFLGCSAYPQCDYLRPLQRVEHKVLKTLEETCPQCGDALALKQGSFGMFIGCCAYPQCDFVVHEEQNTEAQMPCPECGKGHLVARRGRQGKTFYGCECFPHCQFSLPAKPYAIPCPVCDFPLALLKRENEEHQHMQCANKACRHRFEIAK